MPPSMFQSRGIRSDNAVSEEDLWSKPKAPRFNPVESGLIMLSLKNEGYYTFKGYSFNPVESGLIMLSEYSVGCFVGNGHFVSIPWNPV